MITTINPILSPASIHRVDLDSFPGVMVRREKEDDSKRQFRKLFKRETAADFVGEFQRGGHLWGFSKGQFSFLDAIAAIAAKIGPSELTVSTWTIGRNDITGLQQLAEIKGIFDGKLFSGIRFLVDISFVRREPGIIAHLRATYGEDCIRVTKNHAKFALFRGDGWRVVCRTSMNLNGNPRLEDLEIKDDPEMFSFLDEIVTSFFNNHNAKTQIEKSVKELGREFAGFGRD